MMLPCPLYQLTGYQCPFCGLQRGVLALFHGHFAEAWSLNPVFWLTLPYLLLLFLGAINLFHLQTTKLYQWAQRDRTLLIYALLMIGWGIVRNILFN